MTILNKIKRIIKTFTSNKWISEEEIFAEEISMEDNKISKEEQIIEYNKKIQSCRTYGHDIYTEVSGDTGFGRPWGSNGICVYAICKDCNWSSDILRLL